MPVGLPEEIAAAAFNVSAAAIERKGVKMHRGEHPRIGALDEVPFVAVGQATMEHATAVARFVR